MLALAVLCAAQFMVILDITVVNVALPSIQGDMAFAVEDLQWVVTIYTLAFGGLLLLGGRAADLLGRRRVFVSGLAVFTGASLASGLASSQEMLLASRGLQGVGAAMLSPAALSLITTVFAEGPERHRALAAWAAVGASGGAFGVLAGGVLTEAFSWEAIFLINVPVGIVVALAALRILPAGAITAGKRIDVAGALLATASLGALIYAIVEADNAGWGSGQTIRLLGLAGAGLAAFVVLEARLEAPLVRLGVFRRRPTVVAMLLMIAGMGTLVSGFFFSSLYLQQVLGHSALRTGLEFLPVAVAIVLAAHAGGHLIEKLGAKPVVSSGLVLGAAGALLLSGLSADGSYAADVLPGFLVLAVGVGLTATGVFTVAMSGVDHHEAGLVSGIVNTSHELGVALGLSVLSAVAAGNIGTGSIEAAAGADPGRLTSGFGDAFRVASAILMAATMLALTALRRSDVAPGTKAAFAH